MQLGVTVTQKNNFKSVFFPFDSTHPLYVHDIGWHKTPPLHTYGPAIRPYYLLHLIESGKGEIERDGIVTPLSAGEAFLIRPNEITTYRADQDNPWTYYWIAFYGDFASTLLSKTTAKLCMPYLRSGLIALKTAMERQDGDTVSCINVLLEVLNCIKEGHAQGDMDVIGSALYYLENNYFREIDITSLAQEYGYSRTHFTSLFSQKTGETPYRYLTKVRIEHAKALLRAKTYSVEEIAYSVGFSCLVRFSETFKRHTGLSPLAYQKLCHIK